MELDIAQKNLAAQLKQWQPSLSEPPRRDSLKVVETMEVDVVDSATISPLSGEALHRVHAQIPGNVNPMGSRRIHEVYRTILAANPRLQP